MRKIFKSPADGYWKPKKAKSSGPGWGKIFSSSTKTVGKSISKALTIGFKLTSGKTKSYKSHCRKKKTKDLDEISCASILFQPLIILLIAWWLLFR